MSKIVYNLEYSNKEEALATKQRVEYINSEFEYKIVEIVNGKPDPIGQEIRAILNK